MKDKLNISHKILESHKGDWNTFFKVYGFFTNIKKSIPFWFSVFVSIAISLFVYFSMSSSYLFLEATVARNLSVVPSILGFAIGAYALITASFSEKILLKIIDEKKIINDKKVEYNTFQKTSATFGIALLSMGLALILNYITQAVNDTGFFNEYTFGVFYDNLINVILIFIINLISLYSIVLATNFVINIFSLSQFLSGMYTIIKVNDLEEVNEKKQEKTD